MGSQQGDRDPLDQALGHGPAPEDRRQHVGREEGEQVQVNAGQPLWCLVCHRVGDGGALVAALGHVTVIAEAAHQLRPGVRDAAGVPADLGRLAGEAVAGDGRQHQVERVLGRSTVRGRVRQRADDPEHLDDRAGPAVRHDQRQRALVSRPHVDEVDVHSVDLGRELRQRVQFRLAPAPVMVGRPVARQLLQHRQLHALRRIIDQLPGGPARRSDAAPEVGDRLAGHVDPERADFGFAGHRIFSPSLDWLTIGTTTARPSLSCPG